MLFYIRDYFFWVPRSLRYIKISLKFVPCDVLAISPCFVLLANIVLNEKQECDLSKLRLKIILHWCIGVYLMNEIV
jgi:hypothetical protein